MDQTIRVEFNRRIFQTIAVLISLLGLNVVAVQAGARDREETSYPANSQTTKTQSRSTVYGRAVYYDSERPVRRVKVMLRSVTSFGPEEISGSTNRDGVFRITGVPAGRYFIGVHSTSIVSPDCFLNNDEQRETVFYDDEMRAYFEEIVVDGKTDKQIVVRARRGAVITGKVTYANGDPAVDHPITVLRKRGDRYSMFTINVTTMQAWMITDDRGTFRVMGLPAGEYLVGSTPVLEHGELVKDETLEANMIGSSLAMTFYPSTVFATEATPIRLAVGEERAAIDITIADQERHRIYGIVRGRDDQRPVADARVNLVRQETHALVSRALFWPYSEGMPGVKTDGLGRWRLTQVPDGKYIIIVKPPSGYYELPPGAKRYSATQRDIEVSGGDVSNVVIEVGDDSTVSGTIRVENGPTPRGMYIGLETNGMSGGVGASTISERGKFIIRNVPAGKMYFFINPGEDIERLYLKSITWKGKDLLREQLDVGVQEKIEGVEIVLSPLIVTFNIRVLSAAGQPVRDVPMTLVPSDPARWPRQEAQLFGTTDANGKCKIIGAPGEYLVFMLPPGLQGSTFQRNEIAERAGDVQRVSLRPGERGTFDLQMRPIK